MEKIIYSKILPLFLVILLINFLSNIRSQIIDDINLVSLGFFKLISLAICVLLFLKIGKTINSLSKFNSYSMSVSVFLISFFLVDALVPFISKNFGFNLTVIVVSFAWFLYFVTNRKYLETLQIVLIYIANLTFNKKYFSELLVSRPYQELNTDVTVQWFPIAANIYESGYFEVYTNNPVTNQGLLPSYIQALVHKFFFNTDEFIFIQINSLIFIFFYILIFFDLDVEFRNKIYISLLFLIFVLNNDWVFYLIGNSLMLEGIAGFLFCSFVINYKNNIYRKKFSYISLLSYLCFGMLIFTKQFLSVITLFLILCKFINIKERRHALLSTIPLLLIYFYSKIFDIQSSFITYADGLDYSETLISILTLENLKLENILLILKQIYIDKPYTLILLFLISTSFLVLINKKEFSIQNQLFFYLSMINFLFIIVLYISYWKNVEIQSSYRYTINMLGLYFVGIVSNINFLQKN
tara:strand:- start:9459 stop:10862 length:1404 start_codon:yes stop_codon:yes gene_type:complete